MNKFWQEDAEGALLELKTIRTFHYEDGIYFKLLENGRVFIIVRESAKPNAKCLFGISIDRDGWESAVKAMDVGGAK